MKTKILILGLLAVCFASNAQWTTTGDNTTTGNVNATKFIVPNPNYGAELTSNWLSFLGGSTAYINASNTNGSIAFRTGGTSNIDMIIDKNGRVGIGKTSPNARLHIANSNSGITPTNMDGLFIENAGSSNSYYAFQVATIGGGKSFSITNAGNVGIGTHTPTAKLESVTPNGNSSSFRLGRADNANYWNVNHAGNDFRLYNNAASGSNILFGVDPAGTVKNNNVGIGTANPINKFHVYNNDANTSVTTGITVEQDGSGDAQVQYLLTGEQRWVTGIDNDDSNKFIIGRGAAWATGKDFVIDNTGNIGIGRSNLGSYKLDVNGSSARIGGDFISSTLRIEATNEAGAPATTASVRIHGYEGRAKGIRITDKNSSDDWFIGEGYNYNGIGIGFKDANITEGSEYLSNVKFFVKKDGKVGIGTATPSSKLEVYAGDSNSATGLVLSQGNTSGNANSARLFFENKGQVNNSFSIVKSGDALDFKSGAIAGSASGTTRMTLRNNGNVGIGTAILHPDYKLAVEGKIKSQEVKVTLANWADFVFEDTYQLPSLEQVEKHIQENGHLENIPTTEEVVKDGIYLGDMNAKLLQKIEELTLYTIEQEKKLKEKDKQLQSINKRIEVLEKLLKK